MFYQRYGSTKLVFIGERMAGSEEEMAAILQAFVSFPRLMGSRHYRTMRFDAQSFCPLVGEASRDVAHATFHATMADRVILRPWDDQF